MGKGGTTILEVRLERPEPCLFGLPRCSAQSRPLENSMGTFLLCPVGSSLAWTVLLSIYLDEKTPTKAPLHTLLSGQLLPLVLVSSSHVCLP